MFNPGCYHSLTPSDLGIGSGVTHTLTRRKCLLKKMVYQSGMNEQINAFLLFQINHISIILLYHIPCPIHFSV